MVNYTLQLGNWNSTQEKVVYTDQFTNGIKFTERVVKEKYSVSEGFSYGSQPKTNTLKISFNGTQAEINTIAGYEYARLKKNNVIYFEGIFGNIKKTIVKSAEVDADVTYNDYMSLLKDIKFPSEVSYFTSNGIKISDPNDQTHSLIHILFKQLFELATQEKFDASSTNLFTLVCNYTNTSVIDYFTAGTSDKIYDLLNDFLKEMGLGLYIHNTTITVIDISTVDSGTAITIPDVESKMKIDDKPYNEVKVPVITISKIKTATRAYPSASTVSCSSPALEKVSTRSCKSKPFSSYINKLICKPKSMFAITHLKLNETLSEIAKFSKVTPALISSLTSSLIMLGSLYFKQLQ